MAVHDPFRPRLQMKRHSRHTVNATATLLAPDHATATLTIRFDPVAGADAGALSLIGMNGCEANAAYEFRRTGN
jgi:hypothetical protein